MHAVRLIADDLHHAFDICLFRLADIFHQIDITHSTIPCIIDVHVVITDEEVVVIIVTIDVAGVDERDVLLDPLNIFLADILIAQPKNGQTKGVRLYTDYQSI